MKNYLRGIIFQKIAYNIFWGLLLLLLLCASLAAGTVANTTRIQKEEKKRRFGTERRFFCEGNRYIL